jgi:hypothetical protein
MRRQVRIWRVRYAGYMQPFQSGIRRHGAPKSECSGRIRQGGWSINQEDGLTFDANVAGIGEGGEQRPEMRFVVGATRIGLLDQNPMRGSVPNA